MKDQPKAILAALLNALIVGLSFLFVKMALTAASPLDTMAHRFTVALVAASIPLVCGWIRLSIKPRDMLSILPLALLYPALFFRAADVRAGLHDIVGGGHYYGDSADLHDDNGRLVSERDVDLAAKAVHAPVCRGRRVHFRDERSGGGDGRQHRDGFDPAVGSFAGRV